MDTTMLYYNLQTAATVCNEKYRAGLQAEQNLRQYKDTLEAVNRRIADLTATNNSMVAKYKNIKSYAAKRKEVAFDLLNAAIIEAGNLVPDADVAGIHLDRSESNRISVLNGRGQNVNVREGGAYRGLLGALSRYAAIKAQPDALPVIFFDESFFALSDATTAESKPVLQKMANDCCLVCIEQRRNIVDGIAQRTYEFKKGERSTTVTEIKE